MALVMFWDNIKMKYLTIVTVEEETVEFGSKDDVEVLI